jgi:hypothetical protein
MKFSLLFISAIPSIVYAANKCKFVINNPGPSTGGEDSDPAPSDTFSRQYHQKFSFAFFYQSSTLAQSGVPVKGTNDGSPAGKFVLVPASNYGRNDIKVNDQFKIKSATTGEYFVVNKPKTGDATIGYGKKSDATVFQIKFKYGKNCETWYQTKENVPDGLPFLSKIRGHCDAYIISWVQWRNYMICLQGDGNVFVKACRYQNYELKLV